MRPVRPTTAALVPTAVLAATADPHGRLPGLLLEWRRVAAGFQGRVVRPVVEANGEVLVVEEWLPAELLKPGSLT